MHRKKRNSSYMNEEFINDRFLGTIFGQAVGDALGLSTEFMSKQEVDRFYPNGIEDYSQIVQDDHRRRWQRGDWTDDTDMMLCILDSFVACQKVDILDIARRFKEWMMNGGMLHNKVQEFYAMYRLKRILSTIFHLYSHLPMWYM